MADKEYRLGNKARDLLKYTNQATKPVGGEVPTRDVRKMLQKIADLDDIRDVQQVCSSTIKAIDEKDRAGFSKRGYHRYGADMCDIAKGIVVNIHSANGLMFETHYQERLDTIEEVLKGCNALLEFIQICVENGYVSVEKSGVWTALVMDVKYMTLAWKKKDEARAKVLRAKARDAEEKRQEELIKKAVREVITTAPDGE